MRAHIPPRILRYAIIAVFLIFVIIWLRTLDSHYYHVDPGRGPRPRPGRTPPVATHPPIESESRPAPRGSHPIDGLVREAQSTFEGWLRRETDTLEAAAWAYRVRRGRHPPPGFDRWWKFATERGAVMVEDLWDQIYDDLNPFWALDPAYIRREAANFEMTINVRAGNASAESDWFWTKIWLNMIKTMEHLLPDMDIALNPMDEPRLVVPWEQIRQYVKTADQSRGRMPRPDMVVDQFGSLPRPAEVEPDRAVVNKSWDRTEGSYWPIAVRGCPPDSAARKAPIQTEFNRAPPVIRPELARPHTRSGFVSNSTLASDICHQPDMQGLQGFFIQPQTTAGSPVLFPLFGGSKLAVNNEILLPPAMYWKEEDRFTGGDRHGAGWAEKLDEVIWRGVATGGRNTAANWLGFQRHRFASMNNGTKVSAAEHAAPAVRQQPPHSSTGQNFVLPTGRPHVTRAQQDGRLGDWLDDWADVGFVDLMCGDTACEHTAPHFAIVDGLDMVRQFNYKYLPDIDGNSFSGRYLGFLRSTSLPIKATLFREWSSSRVLAWKHFVPMDARFGDWYAIMEYFLGYDGGPANDGSSPRRSSAIEGHDEVAERIATDGKAWAEMVLRREDMQIYTLRLLLEYGRLADDSRDVMGWVEDVL